MLKSVETTEDLEDKVKTSRLYCFTDVATEGFQKVGTPNQGLKRGDWKAALSCEGQTGDEVSHQAALLPTSFSHFLLGDAALLVVSLRFPFTG